MNFKEIGKKLRSPMTPKLIAGALFTAGALYVASTLRQDDNTMPQTQDTPQHVRIITNTGYAHKAYECIPGTIDDRNLECKLLSFQPHSREMLDRINNPDPFTGILRELDGSESAYPTNVPSNGIGYRLDDN